jgi:RNA polymerase sigma factor (sigma-70 family)
MDRQFFIKACAEGGHGFGYVLRLLARDYWDALMREAMVALGNRAAAQDFTQDTLIKAWSRCATFGGRSELYPWLQRILRNALIDHWRKTVVEEPCLDEQGQPREVVEAALRTAAGASLNTLDDVLQSKELERLYRASVERFARDHPMDAQVIRWVAEEDLTLDELSSLLGRTRHATSQYVSQCRIKIRPYLREWYLLATAEGPGRRAGGVL